MASAQEYLNYLNESGLLALDYQVATPADARAVVTELRLKQQALRLTKKNVAQDMKALRLQFQAQAGSAGAGTSAVLTLFGKRAAAGHVRANAKRDLKAQCDQMLAPYQHVKNVIDNALLQSEAVKVQMDAYTRS